MAPNDAPARRRRALLVATATYADPGLAALRAPTSDVASLAAVLGDEAIGGFEVRELVDLPTEELRREIETFFGDGRPHDLLLLYVSGHGVLSQSRRFYFATASTSLQLLRSTGIEDAFVNDVMQASRARSIVLVLDCCHSGAFAKGLVPKSSTAVDVEHRFEGHGRVVLSASTELEYAFEQADEAIGINELEPAAPGSLFTRTVVEGLRTGDADVDRDGRISVDDLYDYVSRRVRERSTHQTPGMTGELRGEIVIARNRRGAQLPPEIAQAIESNLAGVREGAVKELAALMATASPALAAAAREALERLADDDSRSVSAASLEALGGSSPAAAPPAAAPPAQGPPPPAAPPDRWRKPWLRSTGWRALAAAAGLLAIGVAVVLLAGGSEDKSGQRTPTTAAPYVFSEGGSASVVLGVSEGAEAGSESTAGVVLVGASGPTLVTDTTAHVPGKPLSYERFGAAVASGDFDKDGVADLAVGVPGKDGVSVLYGPPDDERRAWLSADDLERKPALHDFGAALAAGDFNRDGYADLAVGAPGSPKQRYDWDTATLHILFGGRRGLSGRGDTSIEQSKDFKEFGDILAAGDVDGDRYLDLLEGGPGNDDGQGGHLSFCKGGPHGPSSCKYRLNSPTTALAVGKLNDDRFADVVQGAAGARDKAGELRVWRGGRSGLPAPSTRMTQDTGRIQGISDPGNEFGYAVAVGELTGDRLADIVASAPYDEGSGTVSLIPGSPSTDGPRPKDARVINPPEIPTGGHFGTALALLDYDGDGHGDLFVAVAGVHNLDDALVYYISDSEGGLNADPNKGTGLDAEAQMNTSSPLYLGQ